MDEESLKHPRQLFSREKVLNFLLINGGVLLQIGRAHV